MSATVTGSRAWARGDFAQEAGVELLIRAFDGRFAFRGCPWVRPCEQPGWFWIDTEAITEHSVGLSGGERRVLAVVSSLIGSAPVEDLGGLVAGVDRRHLHLILAALAHAAGSHKHVELVCHGDELRLDPLPALVPWPAAAGVGRAA
jgi:hypothetical protein